MRRWLCVFMMVFLPVQFGWAAVESYCDFETPAQAQHAGHHEHHAHHDDGTPAAAHGDANGDTALAPEAASGGDVERGHHHLGEFAVVLLPLPALPRGAEAAAEDTVWLSATPLAPPQRRPERPQWRHRA